MPRKAGKVPSFCLHRHSGRAVVRIGGRDRYLGPYGSPESHQLYARLIAEWESSHHTPADGRAAKEGAAALSVNELLLAYWAFAESYYTKNGKQTGELDNIRHALFPLRHLYGEHPAAEFGPKLLAAVRQYMIREAELSRGVINQRVGVIKRMFSWGVAEELVPPDVIAKLRELKGLRSGKTEARETEPIRPVPDLHVALTLPFVSPQVAAMIMLQRLTGMRAGEMVIMRHCDIDMTGDVWVYEPHDHKNQWRGQSKTIALGPEAQRIIEPYLDRPADAYLFSPAEAEAWRNTHCPPYHGRERKTPVYPSELRRRAKIKQNRRSSRGKSNRPRGNRYDTNSYRRAIERGFEKAAQIGVIIPAWHPHRLRHSKATEVRRQFGIEAAQVVLGHATAAITQVYAQRDMELAQRVARSSG